jgi:phosphoribosyl 1,2-cyclic phosphodiesterase
MRIKFWGTRGSIAQSGIQTLRYGGHTSCVEIRSEANDVLILDAGTGLQGLSRALMKESSLPRTASILISHTHWDHIQGLPFFHSISHSKSPLESLWSFISFARFREYLTRSNATDLLPDYT